MNDELPSRVTLRDIAKSLGVSHVAVSLALRDHPKISPARRKEVREAAERMGYRPNPIATALGQQRSTAKDIAVNAELAWINHWDDPTDLHRHKEFDCYWKGARQTATKFGYHLEEFVCDKSFTMARLEKVLLARNVRGILIPPHPHVPPAFESFHWDRFCIVRFGFSIPNPAAHLVTSDQVTNCLLACEKIKERGYERIGHALNSKASIRRHTAGMLLFQSHIEQNYRVPPLILETEENTPANQAKLRLWLKEHKPDVILTDIAAMREMLTGAGYHVPNDIGLAVFSILDGNADAGIDQRPEEIGKVAMETLISQINHNYIGIPKYCFKVMITGEWVDGKTLPPKNN